jgi:hypothetical protein
VSLRLAHARLAVSPQKIRQRDELRASPLHRRAHLSRRRPPRSSGSSILDLGRVLRQERRDLRRGRSVPRHGLQQLPRDGALRGVPRELRRAVAVGSKHGAQQLADVADRARGDVGPAQLDHEDAEGETLARGGRPPAAERLAFRAEGRGGLLLGGDVQRLVRVAARAPAWGRHAHLSADLVVVAVHHLVVLVVRVDGVVLVLVGVHHPGPRLALVAVPSRVGRRPRPPRFPPRAADGGGARRARVRPRRRGRPRRRDPDLALRRYRQRARAHRAEEHPAVVVRRQQRRGASEHVQRVSSLDEAQPVSVREVDPLA